MKALVELYPQVESKIIAPVCVAMGPVWAVAQLAHRIGGPVHCFQMDLYQAGRMDEAIREDGGPSTVVTSPDLWDLKDQYQTVILPALYDADRELKIDLVEQAWHILKPGGMIIIFSEHTKDVLFGKLLKKVFGKVSVGPAVKDVGTCFWATKADDGEQRERRLHQINYHAKLPNGPSMNFVCKPGIFSYGEFDKGSRAMLEVVEFLPEDRVLDMGCGVGTVGCLASTRLGPNGHVTFVDSHLRATSLSEQNAKENGLKNYTVYPAATFEGLRSETFDVVLANPPYYNNAEIANMFVETGKRLLKTGGRFYFVTRMPTATVPMIFEYFGDCSVIENRGYSVVVSEKQGRR